jgi:transposase-like protein
MADFGCPWCESKNVDPKPVRMHDDGSEFRCRDCNRVHTRKDEAPGVAFLYFPGDLYKWKAQGEDVANREIRSREK